MERTILDQQELEGEIASLKDWSATDGWLRKRCEFADFKAALERVNAIGVLAEEADHHPDITFGWGYAEIALTTHDRGGVTDVDIALARKIDALD